MSNRHKSKLACDGGADQSTRNDELAKTIPSIAQSLEGVNPQAIPTTSGGPVHWAICDALFSLRDELEARGLDCPHDAIAASYAKMLTASYIPAEELTAVEQ